MQTSSTDLLILCDTVATAYGLKAEEDMGQKTATKQVERLHMLIARRTVSPEES